MSGLRGQQTILYVGGLAAEVTEELVHAAFIPFGDIKSVQISKDYVKSKCPHALAYSLTHSLTYLLTYSLTHFIIILDKSKGFGFVEFDQESDCSDALENMDGRYSLTHSVTDSLIH